MTTIQWTVVKPRGVFNENNETNNFSVKEVISVNNNTFVGEIYSLKLNYSASIYNLFDIRSSKAYYGILIKSEENQGWFKILILGKDVPLDMRFSKLMADFYSESNQYYLMMIEENDVNHFDPITYNKIEFGSKILFDMMMDDFIFSIQNFTTSIFRNLINSYLGTGLNPFGEEVHRVIKEEDLSQLKKLNYTDFLQYNKEKDDKINKECFITLNDFKEGDEIIVLPCLHAYISTEIEKWLKENSNKCPVCRKEVGEGNLINIE